MYMTATYSPEDNKLRLSCSSRLDTETYALVKGAGFSWAPRQDIFVAPMWTPQREDVLIQLCDEIGDEDTSLVDRAEQRAERFEDYSASRHADAEAAHKAVSSIADGIPFGQPILVGHHSERHARKDAERIENGMRCAVKMWETANYWTSRAAGALRAAKYKELPSVRARRIKGLEADLRKWQRNLADQDTRIRIWSQPMTLEQARLVAGRSNTTSMETYFALDKGTITAEAAAQTVLHEATAYSASCTRWIQHLTNRLEYERAMLGESGGIAADRTKPEKGGACRCWVSPRHGAGWSTIQRVNKVSVTVLDNWGNGGQNFTRTVPFDALKALMTAAEVREAREAGLIVEDAAKTGFVLIEAPEPPTPTAPESDTVPAQSEESPRPETAPAADFEAMRETLRTGVQVVTAPQLFPTPAALADRMVEDLEIRTGQTVLEPSAGTGVLLDSIRRAGISAVQTAVEVNYELASRLRFKGYDDVRQADFLQCNGDLGTFDRILMNPPFSKGQDIAHIRHAMQFLNPGGRMVALCANGPRQQETLRPLIEDQGGTWTVLPAGSFEASGTSVNVALIVVDAQAATPTQAAQ